MQNSRVEPMMRMVEVRMFMVSYLWLEMGGWRSLPVGLGEEVEYAEDE
jgi:hypothetical protein